MHAVRVISWVIVLFLIPVNAWALCKDRNVKGKFQLYATTHTVSGTFWTFCAINIRDDGTIEPGTSCVQGDSLGAEGKVVVDGGNVSIGRSCKVKGDISIGGFTSVIRQAWMSRDKNVIEGVGLNPEDGSIFRFSAVRRN